MLHTILRWSNVKAFAGRRFPVDRFSVQFNRERSKKTFARPADQSLLRCHRLILRRGIIKQLWYCVQQAMQGNVYAAETPFDFPRRLLVGSKRQSPYLWWHSAQRKVQICFGHAVWPCTWWSEGGTLYGGVPGKNEGAAMPQRKPRKRGAFYQMSDQTYP